MGFLSNLTGLEKIFFFCAFVGGIVFMIRLGLLLFGFGHADVHLEPGMDVAHGMHIAGDSDTSFQLVSIHGLTAFFLMFGLVGLTLSRQSQVGGALSVLGAFVAGSGALFLMAYITSQILKLQSSGTIDIKNALGQEGTVYLTIPEDGTGEVQISVQGRLQEFAAASANKKPIKTGDRIRVVEVASGNVLIVERI